MNIVSSNFLHKTFPPIKYAFISNYIIRTSRIKRLKPKEKPLVDTILVCDNLDNWHKQNFKLNKNHYPLISKFTSVRLVTYFAKKGAKIHFNEFKTEDGELLRYGVVGWEDFKKDLNFWKTLTVSTYMHKPFEVVIDSKEIEQYQKNNIISAISIGALFNFDNSKDEFFVVSERNFYDAIIQIPFVRGSYFKIFDDEIINFDINDIIDEFRQMYLPVIEDMKSQTEWDDFIIFNEDNATFKIKNSLKAKEFFLNNLNLQVYREVSKLSHGIIINFL